MASGDELKMPSALVVPGSGQGHINSCLLLARSLAAQGFEVRFVYFSSEYAKLKAKNRLVDQPNLAHTEGGAGGPFSQQTTTTHSTSDRGNGIGSGGNGGGAKDTATTTSSLLSTEKFEKGLIHTHVVEDGFAPGDGEKPFFVTPAMKENVLNLILELREQGNPLTCLVADPFAHWTADVAERASIPFINYWTSNAMAIVLIHHLPRLFAQGIFPEKGASPTQWKSGTPLMLDFIPGLPPLSSEIYPPQVRFVDASNPLVSLLCEVDSCMQRGERMVLHTLSELEPDAFCALQVAGISCYAIGPLLHYTEKQEITKSLVQAKENELQPNKRMECIAWLNTQAESSVIYIAFGSQASISAEDIQELAFGLEACGIPFLWVIRDDSCGGQGLQQVLPNGFLDRIHKNGMIINWAPQVEVLAHNAIGGFFTHCGWNSTLESLWEGVPMLCCPVAADQLSNAQYICNVWGVGLELGRTDMGGIERGSVEVGVKGLMKEEKGIKARKRAKEVMQLARKTCQQGGQSFSNLQKFYEDMKELSFKESVLLNN